MMVIRRWEQEIINIKVGIEKIKAVKESKYLSSLIRLYRERKKK